MIRVKCIAVLIIAHLACTVDCLYQQCTSSSQCESPERPCCRTSRGIVDRQEGLHDLLGGRTGVCGRVSKRGETCLRNACGCESGTTCYRPMMQGACCPIFRCYEAKWAKEQEEYWNKCLTGKIRCRLPMSAPPAGGPSLL